MTSYQVERFGDIYTEAADLVIRNYNESAFFKDIKLDPDVSTYLRLEAANQLLLVTARNQGELVGYSTNFLLKNPHYRVLQAYGDLYFVHPKHRDGTGMKMLKFSEEVARNRGAVVSVNATKVDEKANNGAIFERMGYHKHEVTYIKRLDRA